LKRLSPYLVAILVVLVTLLALALRLFKLDAQSLWYDEGFSVYLARMSLAEIAASTAADIQPPLYYYLLHGWMQLFGDSSGTLRAFSLVFGVLSVPLVFAVGRSLFGNRLAGLLAALLMALSPLHIWYGQELRMYTLLGFLGLLSSYILLQITARAQPAPSRQPGRVATDLLLWLAYTLTTVAALYTHYFAFFLLAFQGVYLLFAWGSQGFRPARLGLFGMGSGALSMAAYVPWLPHLLARYGADASYWPGQLKLGEVLVDIAVSWVGGESISEWLGVRLAIGFGAAVMLCILVLALRRERDAAAGSAQQPLAFLLFYLLMPPALILLLSYNAPKFNARYVMISQPALLLLLGGGLAALVRHRGRKFGMVSRWVLAAAALLLVVGTSAYATYQAYAAPAFARADFRGAAAHVQQSIQPDETIILCSGHMFPVWDLYAPGIERHLLPDSPTLDTTRLLDYSIASELNSWLSGKGGVWLVLWQDEVVDPVGYLPAMLEKAGEEVSVDRSFAQLDLRHYRLDTAAHFSDQPDIEHPSGVNFGDRLKLLGYSQTGPQQVTFFWEALRPLDQDYRASIVLRDPNNQIWGQWDGRPSAYLYPTNRWEAGRVVMGRYDLVPVAGTPPGDYGLDVGVYTEEDPVGLDVLDVAGAAQGKRAVLGAVSLSVPPASLKEIDVPYELEADLGGGLQLMGWDLSRTEAQPGDRVLLTLVWSVSAQPQADYSVRLTCTDAVGSSVEAGLFSPTNAWHPTSGWAAGQAWRGQNTFRVPVQMQPGGAQLSVQLVDGQGTPLGPVAKLGSMEILPTERSFVLPEPQVEREAVFGGRVGLLGADLGSHEATPGGALRVMLYWQALAAMDVPYSVFVHLVGEDGRVVAGHDGEPVRAARPTTGWVPGEFLADPHDIAIPADLPSGDYVIEVGIYDPGAPGMPRLQITGETGQAEGDRVIFGPISVRQP
jgi:4-amino-4-deoxy-L-arabinose transferase-like glycosyltransferase